MNKSMKLVSAFAAAFGLVGVTLLWLQPKPSQTQAVEQQVARPPDQLVASSPRVVDAGEGGQTGIPSIQSEQPAATFAASNDADERSEDPAKMFKADANGDLVLKERTRLNIEKLSALYTPEELQQRLTVIEQTLPSGAYQQLADLMDRYKNFTIASKQALPPGSAPATVEDAVAQFDQLHALRVAHFGSEATDAMYGHEEKIGRQLLSFMALEKHEGLTMEEKAMKAQEMLSNSPELMAAYEANRSAAPSEE